MKKYEVFIRKAAIKNIGKAPESVKILFDELIEDLKEKGPVLPEWPKYSRLKGKKSKYHCHLNYSWIACWHCESGSIKIEVYYAGSREEAPY